MTSPCWPESRHSSGPGNRAVRGHGLDTVCTVNPVDHVMPSPKLNSKLTQLVPGSGATRGWRNLFGQITAGQRAVFSTNTASLPWLQLDLGTEMTVRKVILRTLLKALPV